MKPYNTIILMVLLAVSAHAENHYVRSDAAGANDGSDWDNAWSELPADLVRGDMYYVADGEYGHYEFDDETVGTTFIYVKKAVADDHGTDTGWEPSYGDGEALFESSERNVISISTSYIDIDGRTGKDTSGYGFRIHALDLVDYVVSVYDRTWSGTTHTNIRLRHCNIHHRGAEIFVPEGEFTVTGGGDRIRVPDASRYNANGGDQIRVESSGTLPAGLQPGTGYTGQAYYVRDRDLDSNTVRLYPTNNPGAPITGMDAGTGIHSIFLRSGNRGFQVHSQAAVSNSLLQYCYIHDISGITIYFCNTSSYNTIEYCHIARNHSDSVSHGEGIQTNGACEFNIIRYNTWEDIEGTAVIVGGNGWKTYGNIFYHTAGYPNPGQTGDGVGMGIYCSHNGLVYNNTAYNLSGTNAGVCFMQTDSVNAVYNNIWMNCVRLRFSGATADYNFFYNNGGGNPEANDWHDDPNVHVAQYNQDGATDPFVNSAAYDFRLAYATDPGIALPVPYTRDMDDNERGRDGTWDRGALEHDVSAVTGPVMPDGSVPFSLLGNPLRRGALPPGYRLRDLRGNNVSVMPDARTGTYLITEPDGDTLHRRIIIEK